MERGCTQWQTDFWQALDGELPATESAALAEHIRGCMACRTASCNAVAMHRNLLEVADRKMQFVGAVEIASPAQAPTLRKSERVRPRVIVLDWRMFGAAAVIALTALGWSYSGLALEGISEVRNALQFNSTSQ